MLNWLNGGGEECKRGRLEGTRKKKPYKMRRTVVRRVGATNQVAPLGHESNVLANVIAKPNANHLKKLSVEVSPKLQLIDPPTTFPVRWGCTTAAVCCGSPSIEKCFLDCTQTPVDAPSPSCVKSSSPCLYPGDSLKVDYRITFNPNGKAKFCYIMNLSLLPLSGGLSYTIPSPLQVNLVQRCDEVDNTLATINLTQPGADPLVVNDTPIDLTSCGCLDELPINAECELLFSIEGVTGTIVGSENEVTPVPYESLIEYSSTCSAECFCVVDEPLEFRERVCTSEHPQVFEPLEAVYSPEQGTDCLPPSIVNTVTLYQAVPDNEDCTELGGFVDNDETTITPGCATLSGTVAVTTDCRTRYCLCKTSQVNVANPPDLPLPSIDYVIDLSVAEKECTVCVEPTFKVEGCSPPYDKEVEYNIIFTDSSSNQIIINGDNLDNAPYTFIIPAKPVVPYTYIGEKVCFSLTAINILFLEQYGTTVNSVQVQFLLEGETFNLSTCGVDEGEGGFEFSTEAVLIVTTQPKVVLCDVFESTCGLTLISNAGSNLDEQAVIEALLEGCITNFGDDQPSIDTYFATPFPLHLQAVFPDGGGVNCAEVLCCVVKNTATLTVNEFDPLTACDSDTTNWQKLSSTAIDKIFPCDQ